MKQLCPIVSRVLTSYYRESPSTGRIIYYYANHSTKPHPSHHLLGRMSVPTTMGLIITTFNRDISFPANVRTGHRIDILSSSSLAQLSFPSSRDLMATDDLLDAREEYQLQKNWIVSCWFTGGEDLCHLACVQ